MSTLKEQTEQWKEDLEKEAKEIFNVKIVDKVEKLQVIFDELVAGRDEFLSSAVFSFPEGNKDVIPVSQPILKIFDTIKAELLELGDLLATLECWFKLKIPPMEDGNNFGVAVLEEIVAMMSGGRISALSVLSMIHKYHQKRAALLLEGIKFRNVEDYTYAIRELDGREYDNFKQGVLDIKNNYIIMLDKIEKNWDKINHPKSKDEEAYLGMY
eukprot:TRINITY_DN782019_c0_g1_i1.p1 TRINITY_DN782019_c0_g1~~TRINITY_DN782019_c0_g1_i1.p1  ORF type:complete len:213 (-),score=63.11 TRINITY_DN782019_c0_g1_i1:255-893(-)